MEQIRHISGVDTRRNPPLAEVEIQLVELDTAGPGFLQRFEGVFRQGYERFNAVISGEAFDALFLSVNPCPHIIGFRHDISGNEAVFNLVVFDQRIIEYVTFEVIHQRILIHIHQS